VILTVVPTRLGQPISVISPAILHQRQLRPEDQGDECPRSTDGEPTQLSGRGRAA
jgi:hypothetical protein